MRTPAARPASLPARASCRRQGRPRNARRARTARSATMTGNTYARSTRSHAGRRDCCRESARTGRLRAARRHVRVLVTQSDHARRRRRAYGPRRSAYACAGQRASDELTSMWANSATGHRSNGVDAARSASRAGALPTSRNAPAVRSLTAPVQGAGYDAPVTRPLGLRVTTAGLSALVPLDCWRGSSAQTSTVPCG
jgi:hypothetical protein